MLKKSLHLLLNFCDFFYSPCEYNAAVWAVILWCTTPKFADFFKSYWTVVVLLFDVITRKNLPPFGLVYYTWAWKGIYFNSSKFILSYFKIESGLNWYSNETLEFDVAFGNYLTRILPFYLIFYFNYFLNYIALWSIIFIWT